MAIANEMKMGVDAGRLGDPFRATVVLAAGEFEALVLERQRLKQQMAEMEKAVETINNKLEVEMSLAGVSEAQVTDDDGRIWLVQHRDATVRHKLVEERLLEQGVELQIIRNAKVPVHIASSIVVTKVTSGMDYTRAEQKRSNPTP